MKTIAEFLAHIAQYGPKTALYYFPDDNALNGRCEKMSYDELIEKVKVLTLELKKKYKEGDIISVHFAKTHEYVPHMLAIWNAGMVYHPDKNPIKSNIAKQESESKPENLCYVISSSGSTDAPKDIGIFWDALFSRVKHQTELLELSDKDCMLGYLDYAWDASLMEALCPLYAGAALLITPTGISINEKNEAHEKEGQLSLFNTAKKQGITITCAILMPEIIDSRSPVDFPGLKKVVSTGASIKKIPQFEEWTKAGVRIFNGWGPTETTIGSTLVDITKKPVFDGKFLIYQEASDTFDGVKLFFFKFEDELPDIEIKEEYENYEVFIGGNGLGTYLKASDEQKKLFINKDRFQTLFESNPSFLSELQANEVTCLFKTGDVFTKKNNAYYFLGRIDRMIKIDGKQIHLDLIDLNLYKNNPNSSFITVYKTLSNESKNNLLRTFFYGNLEKSPFHLCYQIDPKKKQSIFPENKKPVTNIASLMASSKPCQVTFDNETQKEIHALLSSYFSEENIPLQADTHLREQAGLSSKGFHDLLKSIENYIEKSIGTDRSLKIRGKIYTYMKKHLTIKGIALLVDSLKISYLSDDTFSLNQNIALEQEPDKKDALVLGLLNELKEKQPGHFYILQTDKEWLQQELFEWIKVDDEKVVIATNNVALEKAKQDRIKFSISRKLKKVYPAIYQQKAAVDEKKESQFVQDVSLPSGNTLFLLGSICSGKTITLRSILHQTDTAFCVYFSLANNSVRTIEELLQLSSFNFSQEEITFLSNEKVLLLIDDYDTCSMPSFLPEQKNYSFIIACRSRYFYYYALKASHVAHCQQHKALALPNDEPSPPENLYSFHQLMQHEKQRLGLHTFTLPDLQYWESKDISLKGYESAFKKLPYERKLHNVPYFAFILELLSVTNREEALYTVEKKLLNAIVDWNRHDTYEASSQSSFKTSNISLERHPDLKILGEGKGGIPIFSFAPMTGYAPQEYALYAKGIARDHPFYCFTFEDEKKREQPFEERIEQYVKTIIEIQPEGDILLLGYSFGTIQAFAVAKKLQQENRKIAMLINIDTPSPKDIQKIIHDTEGNHLDEKLLKIKARYPKALSAGDKQASVNFRYYNDFANQTHEKQSFRMTVFYAGEQLDFINQGAIYDWPCEIEEKIIIPGKNHFNLLEDKTVLSKLRTLFSAYERHLSESEINLILSELLALRLKEIKSTLRENEMEPPAFLRKEPSEKSFDLDAILAENLSKLIVTGDPGSGKTTSLRIIEKKLLSKYKHSSKESFPLFFTSASLAKNETLKSLLAKKGLPLSILQQRKFFFLIDGLDESVDPSFHEQLVNDVFSKDQRIILSMRKDFYNRLGEKWKNTSSVTVLPFSDKNISSYLEKRKISPDILDKNNFRELAKNPLTLSLLIRIPDKIFSSWLSLADVYKNYILSFFKDAQKKAKESYNFETSAELIPIFIHYNQIKSCEVLLSNFLQDHLDSADSRGIDFLIAEKGLLSKAHQTFAEYFVASMLLDEIKQFRKSQNVQSLRYFERFFLLEYLVITRFLTELIQGDEEYPTILFTLYVISRIKDRGKHAVNAINCLNYLGFSFDQLKLSETLNSHIAYSKDTFSAAIIKEPKRYLFRDLNILDAKIIENNLLIMTNNNFFRTKDSALVEMPCGNLLFSAKESNHSLLCFFLFGEKIFCFLDNGSILEISQNGADKEIASITFFTEDEINLFTDPFYQEKEKGFFRIEAFADKIIVYNKTAYACLNIKDSSIETCREAGNTDILLINLEKDIIVYLKSSKNLLVSSLTSKKTLFTLDLCPVKKIDAILTYSGEMLVLLLDKKLVLYIDLALKMSVAEFYIDPTNRIEESPLTLVEASTSTLVLLDKFMADILPSLNSSGKLFESSILFYSISTAIKGISPARLEPVPSIIHPSNPLVFQKNSPSSLQAISLITKTISFQINLPSSEGEIEAFSVFEDHLYILTLLKKKRNILRYGINDQKLFLEIEIPRESYGKFSSFHFIKEDEFYCESAEFLLLFKNNQFSSCQKKYTINNFNTTRFSEFLLSAYKKISWSLKSEMEIEDCGDFDFYTVKSTLEIREKSRSMQIGVHRYEARHEEDYPFITILDVGNYFLAITDRTGHLIEKVSYQQHDIHFQIENPPINAVLLTLNNKTLLALGHEKACAFFSFDTDTLTFKKVATLEWEHYFHRQEPLERFYLSMTYQQKNSLFFVTSKNNVLLYHVQMQNDQLDFIKCHDMNYQQKESTKAFEKPSNPTLSHFFKHANINIVTETHQKKSTELSFFNETGKKKSFSISHKLREAAGFSPSNT